MKPRYPFQARNRRGPVVLHRYLCRSSKVFSTHERCAGSSNTAGQPEGMSQWQWTSLAIQNCPRTTILQGQVPFGPVQPALEARIFVAIPVRLRRHPAPGILRRNGITGLRAPPLRKCPTSRGFAYRPSRNWPPRDCRSGLETANLVPRLTAPFFGSHITQVRWTKKDAAGEPTASSLRLEVRRIQEVRAAPASLSEDRLRAKRPASGGSAGFPRCKR